MLSPLYLPPTATWLAGYELVIESVAMTMRLVVIVAGACACAIHAALSLRFVLEYPRP